MKYIYLTLSMLILTGCNLLDDKNHIPVDDDAGQIESVSITTTTELTPQELELSSINEIGTSDEPSAY